jgi:hypothetical protein
MASPLTANFLAAWRRENRDIATLVKVELTSPSALTLYLGSREVATPGTPPQVWQAALADIEPIARTARLRESSWAPMSAGFTVLDVPLAHQTGGKRALDVFRTHRWIGAICTFYFWDVSLTAAADLATIGHKFMVQGYEVEGWKAIVRAIQRWDWNLEADLVPVNRKRYARAPEDSLGHFIPKVRGSVRGNPLRPPWLNRWGDDQHGHDLVVGARHCVAGIVVDAGGGGTAPGTPTRVLFASHACKVFHDQTLGAMPLLAVDDKLAILDPADADVFNTSADGAGFKIADVSSAGVDPFAIGFYPMPPVNVELVAANNAENPRAALDVANETSYALLDYDAGYRELRLRLPTVPPPGDLIATSFCIGYTMIQGSAASTRFRMENTKTASTFHDLALAGATTPTFEAVTRTQTTWDGFNAIPDEPWAYGQTIMRLYFSGAPADSPKLRIFYMGVVVKFRPNREVVGDTMVGVVIDLGAKERIPTRDREPLAREIRARFAIPVFSYAGSKWFAELDGYADAGGAYTGNGTDLIQRAPDLAHHVLVLEGLEATADVETGVGAFGSFVDARALLKTWRQSDMVHAVVTADPDRVSAILAELCRDAGIWIYLSEFDNKWKCVVWKKGAAVDYSPKITVRDIAAPGPRLRPTPGSRRETGVRVPYGYDAFRGRTVHECSIGPGRSVSGHKYRNLRDQHLTVVASGVEQNNKLDFHVGVTDYTATLTTGDYASGIAAAQDVQTKMNAAFASDWIAGWGPVVVAGFNDTIRFNDGADKTATIAPGAYATMEALATAAQTAMNAAASSGWTCTYSRSTRRIYLRRSSAPENLLWGTGAVALKRAMALLGYQKADIVGTDVTAQYDREEEMFHIGNLSTAFDIEWETGTNGTNGTNLNCANLFGYDGARDNVSSGATDVSFMGVCPKNVREQAIAALTGATGERPPLRIDGSTIYDHDTAREVRDRATDLLCVNRPECWFPLLSMPDMESGRVFECDASLDELWPYAVEGSDGSWAGKKWQVLDKVQHAAGSYVTEVLAVEIS